MLLRELFEETKKTAVLAFGRLNPPTVGHAKLVSTIESFEGDHYLFLSQSQKPKTDPLDFPTKLKFAKQFFPGINIGHQSVRTPVQALEMLQSLGYTDVIFIAGSDRVDGFQKLFNTYNGQPDKSGKVPFKFNSIKVASAGERDPDADDVSGMSASKMRVAAASGDIEAFAKGVPNPKLAKTMFDAVRKGMGITEPVEEIMAFGIPSRAKRATIKKKKEKFDEPSSIRDRIAARRKAAAKGDKDAWKSKKELVTAEADLVLDKQALVKYIKDQIQDYVNREDSVENLSALLKYIAGKQITSKGKRFVVSKEDIQEALSTIERELTKGEEKKKEKYVKEEQQLDEIAPAVGAAVMWILRWIAVRGAWPVLKWLLKKFAKYIIGGSAAAIAISEGWEWVTDKIGEEATQMLIDNKFTIAMAVTLILGAVVLKKWIEKHGEKFPAKYAESLEQGDLSWMN